MKTDIDHAKTQLYSPEQGGDRIPSAPIRSKPLCTAMNGSMVQDFADMQRLGRDMDRMKTGQELNEEGLVDDPIQY
ncbi:hypothetical protein [Cohnella terricola]|uniref:Uncharacterized protein n=1 Tax=Cohnella terricola TaxID=1289167 RepID=A0A559J6H7_9BACL|nr:hypothetical protein [Cohnella terricola]TVX95490.1 hypothetical protein FPZ45_23485 [Cohnella terricola]